MSCEMCSIPLQASCTVAGPTFYCTACGGDVTTFFPRTGDHEGRQGESHIFRLHFPFKCPTCPEMVTRVAVYCKDALEPFVLAPILIELPNVGVVK